MWQPEVLLEDNFTMNDKDINALESFQVRLPGASEPNQLKQYIYVDQLKDWWVVLAIQHKWNH